MEQQPLRKKNLSPVFSTQSKFYEHGKPTFATAKIRPKGGSLSQSQIQGNIKHLNLGALTGPKLQGSQTQRETTQKIYTSPAAEPYVQISPNRAIGQYMNKSNEKNNEFTGYQQLLTARDYQQSSKEQSSQSSQNYFQQPLLSQTSESKNNLNYATNQQNASILSSQGVMNLSFVGNSEEIGLLKSALSNMIAREEEVLKNLVNRANKLSDMVSMLAQSEWQQFGKESDFVKMREAVQELSLTLTAAARNEIELGTSSREIEKLQLENRHLSRKNVTQQEKNAELQKIIELQLQRIKVLQEENNKYMILLNSEKKDNRVNTKKVSALEKRVEFILENEVNVMLNPNDKLRQSLNELLRENESLKRDLTHKNQEIERNLGNIKRMTDIITRLNSKIDSLKREPLMLIKHGNDGSNNPNNNSSDRTGNLTDIKQSKESSEFLLTTNARLKKNDDIDLFSNFVIPTNLDFRVVSLKADHQNLISDLMEGGSLNFTKQIMTSTNVLLQKDTFNLIASQFLSFKELSEKVNLMISEIHSFFREAEWKDLIPDLNSAMAKIFNAFSAHIWIIDSSQGILVTYESGREKKILIKGLIGESFFSRKPINSKNARNKPLLYLLSKDKEESVIVDTCLIVPIVESKTDQVKMIVEMSNSKNELFSFDEEYLSIILAHYLSLFVSGRYQTKMQETALKFNAQLLEELDYLMYAQTKPELAMRVRKSYHRCFGISSMVFYFVEDDQLVKYNSETSKESFSLFHGLVGQSVQDQKPYIITDIKTSSYFNKLVDLNSILPVFAIPFIDQDEANISEETNQKKVLAVLEIALKQKYRSSKADMLIDGFTGYFGFEEQIQTKVQQFSQIIVHAIKHCIKNISQSKK